MPKKNRFEAPISKWIRLYCNTCAKWSKTCGLTKEGLAYMRVCMLAFNNVEDQTLTLLEQDQY